MLNRIHTETNLNMFSLNYEKYNIVKIVNLKTIKKPLHFIFPQRCYGLIPFMSMELMSRCLRFFDYNPGTSG